MHLLIVYLIFLDTNQRPRAIGVESDDGYQITIPQFVPQDIYLELVQFISYYYCNTPSYLGRGP